MGVRSLYTSEDKIAVVTGAAGFAGMNLVEALLAAGYFVYAVVRVGSAHNMRLAGCARVRVVPCDLSGLSCLPEKLPLLPGAVFFHLGWQGARDDFAAQYANIADTIAAIEAAARLQCRRFLCTGSQAEYGLQKNLTTEETLPSPSTAYGAAKLAACYLSRRRAQQLGVEWVWGRIFSLYGKYEPGTTLLGYLAAALKKGETPRLTMAQQNWDYLYGADAGEALLALAERAHSGNIYNIAQGQYRPLREFIAQMKMAFAPDAEIDYGGESREIVSLQPSVAKIQRDTGWQARTTFADGIRMAYC